MIFLIVNSRSAVRSLIRNNMHIHIWSIGNKLFCKRRFSQQTLSCDCTSSDHNLGNPGQLCKFCNLKRDIVSVNSFYGSAKLLGKINIGTEPLSVFFSHGRKL